MPRFFYTITLAAALVLAALPAQTAQAESRPRASMVGPQPVDFTQAEAPGKGCQLGQESAYSIDYPDGYAYVQPSDQGQFQSGYWFCPPKVADDNRPAPTPGLSVKEYIIWAVNGVFSLIATIGNIVLYLTSKLLGTMLSVGSFITNDFVRTGWPIVQGFVNVGFIVALLFIALMTTLRVKDYSYHRMLPRLLISALLVNFSLVIGGLIIDFSRLAMAVIIRLVGAGDLSNIGGAIVKNSQLFTAVFNETTAEGLGSVFLWSKAPLDSWSSPVRVLISMVFIWILAFGMLVITVGLVMRYIWLILLLIASPAAYLAYALPKAEKWWQQWWANFLKWVLYGPVALMVLVILVKVGGAANLGLRPPTGQNSNLDTMLLTFLNVGVTAAFLIAAHKAGNKLGDVGGKGIVDFTTKRGKQAAQFAYRHPIIAGTAISAVTGGAAGIIAGAGTVLAKRGATNVVDAGREFKKGATSWVKTSKNPVAKTIKSIAGPDRDKEGKLKPGEESWGAQLGKKAAKGVGLVDLNKQKEAATAKSLGTITPANVTDPSITPTQLAKGHVTKALGTANVNLVIEHGTEAQQKAITRNKDYIRTIAYDAGELSDLQGAIMRSGLSAGDQAKAIDRLQQTLDEIYKE